MGTIIVDAATRDLLLSGRQVELRDENGVLLARTHKASEGPPVPPTGYEISGKWPTDEEIERRMREGKRYTIEQVLERLRSLDNAS